MGNRPIAKSSAFIAAYDATNFNSNFATFTSTNNAAVGLSDQPTVASTNIATLFKTNSPAI